MGFVEPDSGGLASRRLWGGGYFICLSTALAWIWSLDEAMARTHWACNGQRRVYEGTGVRSRMGREHAWQSSHGCMKAGVNWVLGLFFFLLLFLLFFPLFVRERDAGHLMSTYRCNITEAV